VVIQGGIARGSAHQLWKGSEILQIVATSKNQESQSNQLLHDHEELRAENLLQTFSQLHFRLQTSRRIPLYFVCHGHQTQFLSVLLSET
jgi:hypothetical protein